MVHEEFDAPGWNARATQTWRVGCTTRRGGTLFTDYMTLADVNRFPTQHSTSIAASSRWTEPSLPSYGD
jgi:hypothetical protein